MQYIKRVQEVSSVRRFNPGRNDELAGLYDADTGLYNQVAFQVLGDELMEQARRYGPPLSVALYRMEWLTEGSADEETVREVSHYLGLLLVENLRRCDIAAHFGNGVFAALLPHTALEVARDVSDRMCKTIIGSPVLLRSGDQIQVLASCGVAAYEKGCDAFSEMLQSASAALGRPARRSARRAVTSR